MPTNGEIPPYTLAVDTIHVCTEGLQTERHANRFRTGLERDIRRALIEHASLGATGQKQALHTLESRLNSDLRGPVKARVLIHGYHAGTPFRLRLSLRGAEV